MVMNIQNRRRISWQIILKLQLKIIITYEEIRLIGLNLLIISELEFHGEIPMEMDENEIPPIAKVPSEVRAARTREVRQIPQRKPTTQIWHGNEFPICRALCETTLSRNFWFVGSIFFFNILTFSFP